MSEYFRRSYVHDLHLRKTKSSPLERAFKYFYAEENFESISN